VPGVPGVELPIYTVILSILGSNDPGMSGTK
jgi:hypothetical protein